MTLVTDPNDPKLHRGVDTEETDQHDTYLVLSEEERAKGFVRPVRTSYIHVGPEGPKYPLRDLTDGEVECHRGSNYIKYESYPKSEYPKTGCFWTRDQLEKADKGCGTTTTMSLPLAETYAREPRFYGATYCCSCRMHLPVKEFIWADGSKQRVGT